MNFTKSQHNLAYGILQKIWVEKLRHTEFDRASKTGGTETYYI